MPHYYFHLRTPHGLQWDEEGVPFTGLDEAYLDVCRAIAEMVVDLIHAGMPRVELLRCDFEIADREGRLLMDVPFAEVLDRNTVPARPRGGRGANAEIERTRHLIALLHQQREVLCANLSRTRELLDRLRTRDRDPRTMHRP
ncbi:DUF6894 family protein [Methylobacterium oxalidis]|uniref:DUF6894 family protein n=1 Tax=Methylobacterium oxalidis TaxID=944322 RepID=UPI003315E8A6